MNIVKQKIGYVFMVLATVFGMGVLQPVSAYAALDYDVNRNGELFTIYDPPCPVPNRSKWKDKTSSWTEYASLKKYANESRTYANNAMKYTATTKINNKNVSSSTVKLGKSHLSSTKRNGRYVVPIAFKNKYCGKKYFGGTNASTASFGVFVEPWIAYRNGGTNDTFSKTMKTDYILLKKGQTIHLYPTYIAWYSSYYGQSYTNSFDYKYTKAYSCRGELRDYEIFHSGIVNTTVSAPTNLPYNCTAKHLKTNGYTYVNNTGNDIYLKVTLS